MSYSDLAEEWGITKTTPNAQGLSVDTGESVVNNACSLTEFHVGVFAYGFLALETLYLLANAIARKHKENEFK